MHWVEGYEIPSPYIWNAFVEPYKVGFSVHEGGNIHVWAKLTLLLENLLIKQQTFKSSGSS